MRLLRRSNTSEFSLTKDLVGNDTIPPYAILSHTWGADTEEVTFEDLTNDLSDGVFRGSVGGLVGTGKSNGEEKPSYEKSGYEKIRFCGEQAKQDSLEYFWVDSCCINKSNNTELSEAINSMFRWYQNAVKCYVYLADVSTAKRKASDQVSEFNWESAFRASRWFTRGWTLQELLGPSSVEFFSREGKRLGDKRTLERQIHEITGIAIPALRGTPLSQFGVDERFSWAENRQTTRKEDKAYSLLGIFDVYMPLIYGEGEKNAFKRLKASIQEDRECIRHLRLTDPRDDKKRIEETKGGLLEDSYHWILEHSDFQQWRNDQQSRLLWIKGNPGKGKTMLLCGIINELKTSMAKTDLLSYFFCQATDSQINNAIAVLRGLVYLLVDQQPSLISHIRKKHDHAGKTLFEDANAWVALSEIFTNILQDPSLNSTYLIIDALDECVADLPKLLDFIVQKSSVSPRVKWIVSSRNWPDIEERLVRAGHKMRLCLELNAESISRAVSIYIQHKVLQLAQQKKYDDKTRVAVLQHLTSNADNTFLWVALVCQNLEKIPRWKTLAKLNAFPLGLDSLYQRMMAQICNSDNADICKRILAAIAIVYRPITLKELTSLVEMLEDMSDDLESLWEIIGLCGSFLTIREGTIYFVHQSAKDYLLTNAFDEIFPSKREEAHYVIFSRSLQVMSRTLRRDMYRLHTLGYPIERVELPDPDPLATSRYSCIYWVDHLCNWNANSCTNHGVDLQDGGVVDVFIRKKYLYWLEALSLCRSMSDGVVSMAKLEALVQGRADASALIELVRDARRFIVHHKRAIGNSPLQVYASALVFSPARSLIRGLFKKEEPKWITIKPAMGDKWSACLQTLEGHSSVVYSVAFSPDGKVVASASDDKTVRLWDAVTGAALQTLKGHSDWVRSVAFSPDGKVVASASYDTTVRLWDAVTGVALQTLEGHSRSVISIAFSLDGKVMASASSDNTVKLWDAVTGAALQTLEGYSSVVYSVAFSTLEGQSNSVAFSPNGKVVASASSDMTVKLWDVATGAALQTLEGHSSEVNFVTFSPDSKVVASASSDNTVRLWDAVMGAAMQTLEGQSSAVISVAFSPDGKVVASSGVTTVRLWDTVTGAALQTLEGHSNSVAFSPDGKVVASASYDKTVRLWDAVTGAALRMLELSVRTRTLSFSTLGQYLKTDRGVLDVSSLKLSPNLLEQLRTLFVLNDWIAEEGKNILWLPHNYRATCVAVWDGMVVLGHSSGRISFLEFEHGSKTV